MTWKCCWTREVVAPSECPYIGEGEEDLLTSPKRRIVEKCLDCFRFRDDLQSLKAEGHPLSMLLPYILEEFHAQRSQIHSMAGFLDSKRREIRFLHELSVVLQTSMDLDEVLAVAMTAITAGKGFGMNRAFLLLADKERKYLRGYLGVGPKNLEEAWHTWEELGKKDSSLKEIATNFYQTGMTSEKAKFRDVLPKLTVSLDDADHIVNRVLKDRKPFLVDQEVPDNGLRELLGTRNFLIMPLISRHRRIGVILADNYVTQKPITPQDMQSLETFAFPVAFAIERTSLYEQLQEKVDKLTAANLKLKEQQELIVRMEKMALVGKITSSIAHSIRNPLMVIGGFTRTLLKNTSDDDPNRDYLQSIVREAKQLDEVLDEVLTYSESLYPVVDLWDINHLVTKVYQESVDQMEQRGVGGSLDLSPELPTAFIDYRQMSFCLRNVIASLLTAIPRGGTFTISTRGEGNCVVMEVTAREGPKLERPHPEVDSDSFFGLSLCRHLLERQGVRYGIADRDHDEKTLTIHLPVERRDPDGEAAGC